MTEKEYIKGFKTNNQKVMAVFYDDCYHRFSSFFRQGYKKDRNYIDDLFHESYMVLYENIQSGKLSDSTMTGKLYSYLLGVAVRKMQAGDRRDHVTVKVPLIVSGEDDEYLNPEVQDVIKQMTSQDESEQVHQKLKDAIDVEITKQSLTPCGKLFRAFYWDRLSGVEIAKKLNYSNADSVKTQKSKCMKKYDSIIRELKKTIVTSD